MNVKNLVGNTPLVNYKDNIYAKFECYNQPVLLKTGWYFIFLKMLSKIILSISITLKL